jgi:hypothetical protein
LKSETPGVLIRHTANDVGAEPGGTIALYFFNEAPDGTAPNRWEKYGTGTQAELVRAEVRDGEPVDLPTGRFLVQKTDRISLPSRILSALCSRGRATNPSG